MRVWPDSGFSLMRLYVEEKKFGHPHASMLRRFQHHIMSNARGETLSIEIVSDWLRSVVRAESLKLAVRRAQLVTFRAASTCVTSAPAAAAASVLPPV